MYFLQTTDVELTSIPLNLPVPQMAEVVRDIGMPRVLDLYSKYDVQSTFFFTGDIVELVPEVIDMVREQGHEIGCHGYSHHSYEGFDMFSLDTQVEHLEKARNIIQGAGGGRVVSFRSPEARINEDTIRALEKTGFMYDSSVCPQRIDGPLSYGFRQKKKWLIALRRPYRMSHRSFVSEGKSGIIEFPISSFIIPFIGTTMRVNPGITDRLKSLIFYEARKRGIPVVFLFHPNECINANESEHVDGIYYGNHSALFSGNVRTRMKLGNLGKRSIRLMGEILIDARIHGFDFITIEKLGAMKFGGSEKGTT